MSKRHFLEGLSQKLKDQKWNSLHPSQLSLTTLADGRYPREPCISWNMVSYFEELGTSLACASSPEQGIDVSSKSWSYLTKTLKIFVFLHFQIRSNRWQNSKTILIMANCHSLKSSTIPLGKLLGKYWVFQLPSLLTTWATF